MSRGQRPSSQRRVRHGNPVGQAPPLCHDLASLLLTTTCIDESPTPSGYELSRVVRLGPVCAHPSHPSGFGLTRKRDTPPHALTACTQWPPFHFGALLARQKCSLEGRGALACDRRGQIHLWHWASVYAPNVFCILGNSAIAGELPRAGDVFHLAICIPVPDSRSEMFQVPLSHSANSDWMLGRGYCSANRIRSAVAKHHS